MKISDNDARNIRDENAVMAHMLLCVATGVFVWAPAGLLILLAAFTIGMAITQYPAAAAAAGVAIAVYAVWRIVNTRRAQAAPREKTGFY